MLGFVGLDLSKNFSLYTVPAALLLGYAPHAYAAGLAMKDYDLAYPRTFTDKLGSDESIDKPTKLRIQRAYSATQNALESLGIYAAAVAAANAAGVEVQTLNKLTACYLVSRVLYNVTYIGLQENRAFAPLRSVFWMTGLVISSTLFIAAGNKVA